MKKVWLIAAASFVASLGVANATTFQFKGDGGTYDSPTGNVVMTCGTVGVDLCTDDNAAGFTYTKDGIEFTATAFAMGDPTLLIQDIQPVNSGLGAFSESNSSDDQTQFDSNESIQFLFTSQVALSNIEFNAGGDTDCSAINLPEGPCGSFNLFIDDVFIAAIAAEDLLTDVFIGTKFLIVAITKGAGFAIAQFDVSDVPIPGAIPLLISGLAGLGFASRKKKAAKAAA